MKGTSDEQPEQAGRRQMAIEVSDEMLHVVLTDPVIVEAGKEALRAVHSRAAAAAAAKKAASEDAGGEGAGEEAATEEAAGKDAGKGASVTSSVIRGDLPEAAGLADVWLDLQLALEIIAAPEAAVRSSGPGGSARRVRYRRASGGGPAHRPSPTSPRPPHHDPRVPFSRDSRPNAHGRVRQLGRDTTS